MITADQTQSQSVFYKLLKNNQGLEDRLIPKWSDYIPHNPTAKQLAFFMLDNYREAFYGGAAGGGKSDALLMGALQYVDNPFFSALLLRKTFADLRLPGALIDRSLQWLSETDAKWSSQKHSWRFPSGASVSFGYLDSELNKFRYQSTEFQYIGFDELTQHWEDDYLYMFSRLRRLACSTHKVDENGRAIYVPGCIECTLKGGIPLRMRGASNPGGVGHLWVKNRYQISLVDGRYRGTHLNRPYIPAFIADNPYLDQESYLESLENLDPVTKAQLMAGDWGVSADGRFKKIWMKSYRIRGDNFLLLPSKRSFHKNEFTIFMTVDPAASTREGPGDATIWRRAPSWTVICTWLLSKEGDLLLRGCKRFRKEVPDVINTITEVFKDNTESGFRPEFVAIEADGLGIGVYQSVLRSGIPTRSIYARSQDKLVRATDVCTRMEQGKVFLPEKNTEWKETVEAELYTWTGHPHEPSDIVDNFSYAGILVSTLIGEGGSLLRREDAPEAFGY